MAAAYLLVCSLTFMGVTGGLEFGSPASLKDRLETEAGGFLLGVARPEKEGVRLQNPPLYGSGHDLVTPTGLRYLKAAFKHTGCAKTTGTVSRLAHVMSICHHSPCLAGAVLAATYSPC